MNRGSSSLPLQEGFPRSPATHSSTSSSLRERKTLRQAAEMLLGPTQPLEQFPGEARRQLLHPQTTLVLPPPPPLQPALGARRQPWAQGCSPGSTHLTTACESR